MAYPISDVPRRIVYSGSAGVGPYAFTFEVLANTDIAVYKNTTLLTLTTDYTVSINAGTGTGTVTLVVAATGADSVTLVGDRAIQRTSDFVTGGDLYASTLNDELDAQTIYTQQVDEKADRAIRAPVTDPTTINMVLPSVSDRAGKYLGFSALGNPIAQGAIPDVVYYGALAADPATRPNATASVAGDLYFNTAVNHMRVYSGSAWIDYEADAEAAAVSATASASTATTQASLATAAKVAAQNAQAAAELAEANAETAEVAAELARDASWTNNKIYASTVAGLAATSSGEYFSVPSGDPNFALELYLNNAGSAVLQKRYLSAAFTANAVARINALSNGGLFSNSVGTASPVSGAAAYGGATTLIFDKPLAHDGLIHSIIISANTSGTVKIKRFTRSGTTLTFQSEISVSVSSGVNTYGPDTLNLLNVTAGDYIALYTPTGVLKYTSATTDAPFYSSAGDNTSTYSIVSSPGTSIRAEARIDIYGRLSGIIASQTIARQAQSVMDERGTTFTIGATTVADKATVVSTTSTFFTRESNPEPGVISQLQLYSKVSGSAVFKVIRPSTGGGYTLLHSYVVQLSAGTNTYSVAGGTLPIMSVPRGCIFGVFANTSSAIPFDNGNSYEGYYAVTGEVTGAVSTLAQTYGRQVQMQVQVFCPYMVRKFNSPTPRYPIDLNVTTAAAIPAGAKSAGMSYGTGYAVSTTTGISSAYVESLLSDNNDRMTARATIQLRSADARVAVYRRPVLNLASVDAGTVAEVDIANNRIILYQSWGGSTLPATRSTKTLTTITLTQNRDYRCDLTNDKKQISFTIYDTVTGVSETLTVDSDAVAAAAGFCYGAPGVAVVAGTGAISRITCFPIVQNPKLLILGDSITEGSGTTQANAWANLTATGMGGLAHVSADGGTASDAMLRRLYDVLILTPSLQYVLILIGTNDAAAGAAGVTNWQTNVPLAKTLCEEFGVTPIIAHVIPRNDANQTHVDSINTYIRAQAYRTVRFDLALSVGNDGSTWNTSLMSDSLHPNTAGHLAMYNRLRLDVPELFD